VGELTLPNGIAITTAAPQADHTLPPDSSPQYYVLVAEQLNRPGVRVYAWLGGHEPEFRVPLPTGDAPGPRPRPASATVVNPHWDAGGCASCHKTDGEQLLPLAPEEVDDVCVSCHDGVKASADPHPIARPANTEFVATPPDWPTVGGAIGCLTCHDLVPHCTAQGRRPAANYFMLRQYDQQRPLAYCSICHRVDVGGRFSPHRQRDATGRVREDACFFCHTDRPEVPADGRRRFEPKLRVSSSALCLNCHSKHWDLSPLGHVDRPVTPIIRQWMLMRELSIEYGTDPKRLARLAAESARDPARLPLGDNQVTCYTCHNPHYTGLFPPDSELGALADNPQDRASALRTDWIDLCSECHSR
jgi:predicted CXXCH cytochrome family protein